VSSPRSYAGPTVAEDKFRGKTDNLPDLLPFKQPWSVNKSSSISSSTPRSSTLSLFFNSKKSKSGAVTQMKLCGNAIDPNATACMDVAIADFIHSHCLPFSLAGDLKLIRIIEEAINLGLLYMPPDRHDIGEKYLDALYVTHWKEQMKTLLSEDHIFGVTVFGEGTTIKTLPLVNVLAAFGNSDFALLEIANCTAHLAKGGKNDAEYISKIIMPLIQLMESEEDMHKKTSAGIVDLVFLD
jgi:hypothetical protein